MGYKRMNKDDLYDLFRRWRKGHSISNVARAIASDCKTVRQYIGNFSEAEVATLLSVWKRKLDERLGGS